MDFSLDHSSSNVKGPQCIWVVWHFESFFLSMNTFYGENLVKFSVCVIEQILTGEMAVFVDVALSLRMTFGSYCIL